MNGIGYFNYIKAAKQQVKVVIFRLQVTVMYIRVKVSVQNRPVQNRPFITDHSKQNTFITDPFITDPFITDYVHNRPRS